MKLILSSLIRGFGGVLACVALAGCSSNNASPGNTAKSAKPEIKSATKSEVAAVTDAQPPKSVFKIDQEARDPFFPAAKRAVAVETGGPASQPAAPMDVPTLLRQGFQGVIGSGETRIALINNVMLEPGRQTIIPISAGGQSRSVPVRCREVERDAVVIEVQGYPQPLKLQRTGYN